MARLDRNGARSLLSQRARRGLTWKELSSESGVPVSTLQNWKRRLGEVGSEPELVEITLSSSAMAGGFELIMGGVTVRVPSQFDPESLATLLQVLSEC